MWTAWEEHRMVIDFPQKVKVYRMSDETFKPEIHFYTINLKTGYRLKFRNGGYNLKPNVRYEVKLTDKGKRRYERLWNKRKLKVFEKG